MPDMLQADLPSIHEQRAVQFRECFRPHLPIRFRHGHPSEVEECGVEGCTREEQHGELCAYLWSIVQQQREQERRTQNHHRVLQTALQSAQLRNPEQGSFHLAG